MALGVWGDPLLVGTVVLAAVFSPWLPPHDPLTGNLRNAYLLDLGTRYLPSTER